MSYLLVGALRAGWTDLPRLVRGEGIYVFGEDGERYVDATCGNFCAVLGHGVPEVARVVAEQLGQITMCGLPTRALDDLAALVIDLSPPGFSHVHLTNSGSEAVEAALLLARQVQRDRGFPDKTKFVSFAGSYHGSTLGARSVTGVPFLRHVGGWCPMLAAARFVGAPNAANWQQRVGELESLIAAEGPETIAALITEPLFDFGDPPLAFFDAVRDVCAHHQVLVIADEVKTGFGRTGRTFAVEAWRTMPDLLTFGKAVSAGLTPLAGLVVSAGIFDTLRSCSGSFVAGHTTAGNPLSCATTSAVLRHARDLGLYARVATLGPEMRALLTRMAAQHPSVVGFHGEGLLWYLRVAVPSDTWADRYLGLFRLALDVGLLTLPLVSADSVTLCLAPPYTATESELADLEQALDRLFTRLEQ